MNLSQIKLASSQDRTQKTSLRVVLTSKGLSYSVIMPIWAVLSTRTSPKYPARLVTTRSRLPLVSMNRKITKLVAAFGHLTQLQGQHWQSPFRSYSSSTFLFQLLSTHLWNGFQYTMPNPMCNRSRPLLPSHSRRRWQTQISQTYPHSFYVFPCPTGTSN